MTLEIIITALILIAAVYLLYKNIKKSAAGKCSGCSGKSPECSGCNTFSGQIKKPD